MDKKEWSSDPRYNSIESGLAFAQSMYFKAIVPEVNAIQNTNYIQKIHEKNLHVYLWGSNISDASTVETLIKEGADMLIFDQ